MIEDSWQLKSRKWGANGLDIWSKINWPRKLCKGMAKHCKVEFVNGMCNEYLPLWVSPMFAKNRICFSISWKQESKNCSKLSESSESFKACLKKKQKFRAIRGIFKTGSKTGSSWFIFPFAFTVTTLLASGWSPTGTRAMPGKSTKVSVINFGDVTSTCHKL